MITVVDAVLWPWRLIQLCMRWLLQLPQTFGVWLGMRLRGKRPSSCRIGQTVTVQIARTAWGRRFAYKKSTARTHDLAQHVDGADKIADSALPILITSPSFQAQEKKSVESLGAKISAEHWAYRDPGVGNQGLSGVMNTSAQKDIQLALTRKALAEYSERQVVLYTKCNGAKYSINAMAEVVATGEKRVHLVAYDPMYKWSLHMVGYVYQHYILPAKLPKAVNWVLNALAWLLLAPILAVLDFVMGGRDALSDWRKIPMGQKSLLIAQDVNPYYLYGRLKRGRQLGERYSDAVLAAGLLLGLTLAVNAWLLPLFTSLNLLTWAGAVTGLGSAALIGGGFAALALLALCLDCLFDAVLRPWTFDRMQQRLGAIDANKLTDKDTAAIQSMLDSGLLPKEVGMPLRAALGGKADQHQNCLLAGRENLGRLYEKEYSHPLFGKVSQPARQPFYQLIKGRWREASQTFTDDCQAKNSDPTIKGNDWTHRVQSSSFAPGMVLGHATNDPDVMPKRSIMAAAGSPIR